MSVDSSACTKCVHNLLCMDSAGARNPFYCIGCGEYSCTMSISGNGLSFLSGRRIVIRDCRYVQEYLKDCDEIALRKRYESFVTKRRALCKVEIEMRSHHVERLVDRNPTVFYYSNVRVYMCEECAIHATQALNLGLDRVREEVLSRKARP